MFRKPVSLVLVAAGLFSSIATSAPENPATAQVASDAMESTLVLATPQHFYIEVDVVGGKLDEHSVIIELTGTANALGAEDSVLVTTFSWEGGEPLVSDAAIGAEPEQVSLTIGSAARACTGESDENFPPATLDGKHCIIPLDLTLEVTGGSNVTLAWQVDARAFVASDADESVRKDAPALHVSVVPADG